MENSTKHMTYVQRKVDSRKRTLLIRFMLIFILCFGSTSAFSAISNPDHTAESVCVTMGGSSIAMCAMVSIDDVAEYEVSGNAIGYKVWLIPIADIDDTVKFPSVNVNREVSTIPLKPGKYMHYFYAKTPPTFLSNGSKEANAIVMTGTNTFTIVMGGNRAVLLNFIEQYAGTKFIVIYQDCASGQKQGIGNACKPVVLSTYENKNDAEGRYVTFTFTQSTLQQPWNYIGSIVNQDPVTIAAGSSTLPLVAGNDRYIIPGGAATTYAITAVTGFTSADKGRVITLIGDGSANAATVADGLPFILSDGTTWTATKGSVLTLKVFDANTLIEVERI